MGTRHLIAAQIDGEYKIAQYGQWDGYPNGQGLRVLEFCRTMDPVKFIEALRETRVLTDADLYNHAAANDPDWERKWPWLSRDTGADILRMVHDGLTRETKDSISFAGDSLFCEWAYVIDMDSNTLEVFRGFNKTPFSVEERFAKSPVTNSGYCPVRMVRKFSLSDLPSDEMFVRELTESDGEE